MGSVKVEGQTLGQTYELDDDIVGEPKIASLQCDFPLCEADFLRLTTRSSKVKDASVAMLFVSVGLAIPVLGKLAAAWWSHTSADVEAWEYWALGISFAFAVTLVIIAHVIRDEKRTLLRNMEQHFESHPRERKVMRPVNDK